MRIIFVRHGEPDYEKDCLTPRGRAQARAAAERLAEEGIGEIYASPLGRAAETARFTADRLGLPVRTLDYMRELHWGSVDGTPLFAGGHPWDIADGLAAEGRDLTDLSWREHPYFANNLVTADADRVAALTDEWLLSLGYRRTGAYYECLRPDDSQATVALFSHGGSSAAAIGHMMSLPFPSACAALHLEFTGITVIRLNRKPGIRTLPCLELVNDSRHIRGAGGCLPADL